MKNRERPRLRRDEVMLHAGRGSWAPRARGHTYQWYRNGRPVRNEIADSFWLGGERAGNRIKVCVSVYAKGHADARACSREAKVPSGL